MSEETMVDYKAIHVWLEKRGFAFNRPYRQQGDTITFQGQFFAYHESDDKDYFRCLEKWLAYELGIHWYMILRNRQDDRNKIWWIVGEIELQDIDKAWAWWNEIAAESE